jgi:hypothetical protein
MISWGHGNQDTNNFYAWKLSSNIPHTVLAISHFNMLIPLSGFNDSLKFCYQLHIEFIFYCTLARVFLCNFNPILKQILLCFFLIVLIQLQELPMNILRRKEGARNTDRLVLFVLIIFLTRSDTFSGLSHSSTYLLMVASNLLIIKQYMFLNPNIITIQCSIRYYGRMFIIWISVLLYTPFLGEQYKDLNSESWDCYGMCTIIWATLLDLFALCFFLIIFEIGSCFGFLCAGWPGVWSPIYASFAAKMTGMYHHNQQRCGFLELFASAGLKPWFSKSPPLEKLQITGVSH